MQRSILAIDAGTSALKAMIIDLKGMVHAQAQVSFSSNPASGPPFNAHEWKNALSNILFGVQENKYDAIVVSGHGPSLVPLNKKDEPSAAVLFWLDGHSIPIIGCKSFFLPKIKWFQQNEAENYNQSYSYLTCPDYFAFLLTGIKVSSIPHNAFIPWFWSSDEIDQYGFSHEHFPPFINSGGLIGYSKPSLNNDFPVKAGIPVFAGGADFLMSMAGSGATRPGIICDRAGSSEGINLCSSHKLQSENLRTLPHLIENYWNIGGIIPASGLLFEWYRNLSGQKAIRHTKIINNIRQLDASDDYPFFIPGKQGFTKSRLYELAPHHSQAEIGKAVLEAMGFQVYETLQKFKGEGVSISIMRMCGGQSRNQPWCQLKASLCGVSLEIPQIPDAELCGNAMAGAIGLGEYSNFDQAANAMLRIEKCWHSDQELHNRFLERYEKHRLFRESRLP